MLYELEVLQSDCDRIGDPVALPLTDIVNSCRYEEINPPR
jgi:hypothetical protein